MTGHIVKKLDENPFLFIFKFKMFKQFEIIIVFNSYRYDFRKRCRKRLREKI